MATAQRFADAGQGEGVLVWRVEKFDVVLQPADSHGSFYQGDSYLVLHTFKANPTTSALKHHLHFWLGSDTSLVSPHVVPTSKGQVWVGG